MSAAGQRRGAAGQRLLALLVVTLAVAAVGYEAVVHGHWYVGRVGLARTLPRLAAIAAPCLGVLLLLSAWRSRARNAAAVLVAAAALALPSAVAATWTVESGQSSAVSCGTALRPAPDELLGQNSLLARDCRDRLGAQRLRAAALAAPAVLALAAGGWSLTRRRDDAREPAGPRP